ncbi:hypothetical protein KP509_04G084200 [Ceratopteris richardii]|uniref:Uncharacterized protein n=1 Tax=Ceratopteris richardii TaxID=49495 RepID=A0A8T2V2H3_CERRI|nr:hypothetical protein KP509_04G084200 [Ceratopteris richardii]
MYSLGRAGRISVCKGTSWIRLRIGLSCNWILRKHNIVCVIFY